MKHFVHISRIIYEEDNKMNNEHNDDLTDIFNQFGKMVYRLAFIQMQTKEQAEDILQLLLIMLIKPTKSIVICLIFLLTNIGYISTINT